MTSTKVVAGDVKEDGVTVTIEDAKGGNSRKMDCEILFVATGRRPLTKGVGLEELGIEMDKFGRCIVNGKL